MKDAGFDAAGEVAALNRVLEELAARGAWEELAQALSQRDRLLGELPPAAAGALLEEALATTRRLLERARGARSETAAGLRGLRAKANGAARYRDVGRS